MALNFRRKVGTDFGVATQMAQNSGISNEQRDRIQQIESNWNFYEGFHWEEFPDSEAPRVTVNYCRTFVNKYVAFELGKGFTMSFHESLSETEINDEKQTVFDFVEEVWEDNDQYRLIIDIGVMKSVTGEAWVQCRYQSPEELDDPYDQYPNGRMRLILMPTSSVFPEYDPHDRDKLVKLTVMYPYEKTITGFFGEKKERTIYKQEWYPDRCVVTDGKEEPVEFANAYGVIPFALIRNISIAGRDHGMSDLDDIRPLNTEYNLKMSNISEIIDYHAAPITVVYGAKLNGLEKGASKMWGGISKDARVENLEMKGDLGSSTMYVQSLKSAICEVGGIPETSLGAKQAISNTSGVALQYINMPLIEKSRIKRMNTETDLENLNRMIILISMVEGIIQKPDDVKLRDFVYNQCVIPDTMPKDMLLELQQVQAEMLAGLETRENAARRLGKENTDELFKKIRLEREKYPEYYMPQDTKTPHVNSGFSNSESADETVRIALTGSNGMTDDL